MPSLYVSTVRYLNTYDYYYDELLNKKKYLHDSSENMIMVKMILKTVICVGIFYCWYFIIAHYFFNNNNTIYKHYRLDILQDIFSIIYYICFFHCLFLPLITIINIKLNKGPFNPIQFESKLQNATKFSGIFLNCEQCEA